MSLIRTVSFEDAEGAVKEMYTTMMERAGMIPKPLEMMSASPALFEIQSRAMGYFMAHPTLGFLLQAHIRLVVAFNHHYPYCIELNSGLLQHFQGLTEAEVAAIRTDPGQARLDEKDRAMLVFVHRAVTAPEDVEAADLDHLRGLGWTDPDIYDAVSYGANMVSSGILFNAFKMSEA